MPCVISSGYTLGCRDSVSGIEWLAITNHDQNTIFTFGTCSLIEDMSPTYSFYQFEQYTEQASATQEGGYDNITGTNHTVQTIQMTFEKMDACVRDQFLALTQARVRIIVKAQNGRYFLFGKKNGGRASAGTSGPGQNMNDLAGFQLTFEFKEPEPAHEIDEALVLEQLVVN